MMTTIATTLLATISIPIAIANQALPSAIPIITKRIATFYEPTRPPYKVTPWGPAYNPLDLDLNPNNIQNYHQIPEAKRWMLMMTGSIDLE